MIKKMRTKHILFTVALGATFAACTSEENFKVATNNGTDAMLAIRPIVGNEFVLGGDEAATRLALGDGARPVWGQNDKVGAAIIDVPTYTSESDYNEKLETASGNALELYNITEYYGCNNAYTTSDGGKTWSAEHPMVEGNYLFYAPYQEGLSLRSPLVVAVPAIQQATSEKKALEDFYNGDNIVQVGYKFITGTETQRPSVTLYNIFAYPKFTINNNFKGGLYDVGAIGTKPSTASYSGTIHVDSIQFVSVETDKTPITNFVVGGQLKNSDQRGNATQATEGLVAKLKQKANGFTADGAWWDLNKMLNEVQTTDLLGDDNQIKNGRNNLSGVITTLVVNQDIESGKSIDLYCVMPAYKFNFDNKRLMAKLFVTINDVPYEICDATVDPDEEADDALTAAATSGYLFDANGNVGLSSLSLMAGQRQPAEALRVITNADGTQDFTLKTDVKGLLTINMDDMVAVRMGALNEGITTTDELIALIQNAANGTAWAEGQDNNVSNTKGFQIAKKNSVEINSALIDALATNNQNAGGSFQIGTVVPISNDVQVEAVDGTKVTFVSNSGKKYDITLYNAVTTAADASDKYAIFDSADPTVVNENSVVIVKKSSLSLNATAMKSLHVVSGNGVTLSAACKVGNIRVDGTLTAASNNITAENIYIAKEGKMSIGKTVTGAVTNNGTIETTTADVKITIAAGTGTVTMNENTASSNISVASGAEQDVIFVCDTNLATAQITKAATIPSVTTIKTNPSNTVSLTVDDIAKFGSIRKIQAGGNVIFDSGTFNMSGFTIEVSGSITCSGDGVTLTTVNGVNIELGTYNLSLTNIAMSGTVNGTGKIIANGTSATWNGGASGQN